MALNRDQVVKAIHDGIRSGNAKYEVWSRGQWIRDAGIESMMTVMIASSLYEAFTRHQSRQILSLEATFSEIENWAVVKKKSGPKPSLWTDGRKVDIAIWGNDNRPRAVIEIKRYWSTDCLRDIDRIIALLDRTGVPYGTLRYGVVTIGVTAVSGDKTKTIEQLAMSCDRKIRDHVGSRARVKTSTGKVLKWSHGGYNDQDWWTTGICAVLSQE
jgi:hypothetical protein